MKKVLLTGGAGALGSALAPELLRQEDLQLVLLLRTGQAGVPARLAGLKNFWKSYGLPGAALARAAAVEGDVSLDRMGLAPETYRGLLEGLTHIVHAAANVKINMTLAQARQNAVATTAAVLALAKDARRLEKLEYVSTVGVAGTRAGAIPEARLVGARGFHNTYESAKAEAEELVWEAMAAGLPVTIHRPSMVLGDSRDGRTISFQVFYHLAEFLSGRQSGGWVPRFPGFRLDVVPNDYVARAIALSVRHPEWKGEVLHLSAGRQGSWPLETYAERLPALMRAGGLAVPRVKRLPWPLFRALVPLAALAAPRDRRKAFQNLPRFLSYLSEETFFDNSNARRLLAPAGLACPPVEAYLPAVMGFYASAQRERVF